MVDFKAAPDLTGFSGNSFRKGHVAAEADKDLAALVFVLDVQEINPGIQRLRDWALARLDPQPGEVAVDVGCGTGTEVRRLAELVGATGRAVGVEPHPGLRAVAEERAAGTTANFVHGDALDLPFPDSCVDVLRCERVFQHLEDADRAAAEFARVLAPGGRAVVIDSDWGTLVQSVGDPDVKRRYAEFMYDDIANPFAGRWLRRQLVRAGLEVDSDIGSTAVVFDDEGIRQGGLVAVTGAKAVQTGAITQAELDALLAEAREAVERQEILAAVTMFAAYARRPF